MDNMMKETLDIFECRHCRSVKKLSMVKEKFDDVAVIEIRCVDCKEKEVLVI